MKVFAIYDKAVGAFQRPFFSPALGEAMRSFLDACRSNDLPYGQHPDDFVLHQLGDFEDDVGVFKTHDPQRLISAREILGKPDARSAQPGPKSEPNAPLRRG